MWFFPLLICAQNQIDSNGYKQGYWKQNHTNGKIRYEGNFVDDKPSGVFKYYDKKGLLKANLEYFDKGVRSSARLYFPDGTEKAIGLFVNEHKYGLWKFFNKDGQLISEEHYSKGVLDGDYKVFYANGQLLEDSFYTNGLKEGASKQY